MRIVDLARLGVVWTFAFPSILLPSEPLGIVAGSASLGFSYGVSPPSRKGAMPFCQQHTRSGWAKK